MGTDVKDKRFSDMCLVVVVQCTLRRAVNLLGRRALSCKALIKVDYNTINAAVQTNRWVYMRETD